jgi:hypothetical protein
MTPERLRLAVPAILAVAAVLGLAVGCTPTGSATASPEPAPSGSQSAGPRPTSWPTTVVESSVALGAAHSDFATMTNDIAGAVASEDPGRIAAVLGDALEFLTANQTNIPRLQAYPATKSVGDRLAVVYEKMIQGLTQVRDGLALGDASVIEAGFATFFEGHTEYVAISPDLTVIAEQAIFMKRVLLR